MKRIISLIVLVVALVSITSFTIYTLKHKEIKKEVETKVVKKIERITSKFSSNGLSEIYNVYLNKQKHKIKLEYALTEDEKNNFNLSLAIYFDGKSVLKDVVLLKAKYTNIEELFDNEELSAIIKLDENAICILNNEKVDYLVLNVGYYLTSVKNKFFIFNSNGDMLTTEDGLLVYDNSLEYVKNDNSKLDIFYDEEKQILAKIDENVIYILEEKKIKKELYLEEYKYFIKDGKLNKELVNTYQDIKLN